jgi:hypothetical protein
MAGTENKHTQKDANPNNSPELIILILVAVTSFRPLLTQLPQLNAAEPYR